MDVESASETISAGTTRPREEDDLPAAKKQKLSSPIVAQSPPASTSESALENTTSKYIIEDLLPPSRTLFITEVNEKPADQPWLTFEADVGITQYVSSGVPPIQGIIKQRFTDFLVYEVDREWNVVHLNEIGKPANTVPKPEPTTETPTATIAPPKADAVKEDAAEAVEGGEHISDPVTDAATGQDPLLTDDMGPPSGAGQLPTPDPLALPEALDPPDDGAWLGKFTTRLSPYLSMATIEELKLMFLQGPAPPPSRKLDSGWPKVTTTTDADASEPMAVDADDSKPASADPASPEGIENAEGSGTKAERGGKGARGRGNRGGRGKGGVPRTADKAQDRKVVTDAIAEKATRTTLHQAIRELFGGQLESEVVKGTEGDNTRIAIRWNNRPPRNAKSKKPGKNPRDPRDPSAPYIPPYIHFTMHKANRDTQDAISHLSRLLKCTVKELAVAGTKDRRGVTTQRVSLKRLNRTLQDVWKSVNNVPGRRSESEAVTKRGERGVRIGDLVYRKSPLDLGHLKGNAFVITLRNVKESEEHINQAMQSMKERGFINYYGMQRFGTSPIPTHSIGLALLQSNWKRALDLILRPRPGEAHEAEAGRRAWLEDRDLRRALQLMPRRMVAERAVLEAYVKNFNSDTDMQNALHAIPKNLRTMYVHAYQSYVWNAIVSERLSKHRMEPIPGDLVFDLGKKNKKGENDSEDEDFEVEALLDGEEPEEQLDGVANGSKKQVNVKVKTLTDQNIHKYTIFDVIMPLPGFDVEYPGGELGEKYKAFMTADGLDPDNMERDRKDYSLAGSYRKIMHRPKELSWRILKYTDPEVPLAQSDEDKILGFDPPGPREDGMFSALQIELQLGTACYATMALREVTKTDTSAHYQSVLTQGAEDQAHRGTEAQAEQAAMAE
ncbi:pseudouridine synthase [Clavulina sp. PMI_390]|nr:pseudouridine synthase [Clavulina sp. PMI_390]